MIHFLFLTPSLILFPFKLKRRLSKPISFYWKHFINIFFGNVNKMWAKHGLFLFIFVSFSLQWQIDSEWKKRRWCAWDSNAGLLDGRCRRIHWAMAAPFLLKCFNGKLSLIVQLWCKAEGFSFLKLIIGLKLVVKLAISNQSALFQGRVVCLSHQH